MSELLSEQLRTPIDVEQASEVGAALARANQERREAADEIERLRKSSIPCVECGRSDHSYNECPYRRGRW